MRRHRHDAGRFYEAAFGWALTDFGPDLCRDAHRRHRHRPPGRRRRGDRGAAAGDRRRRSRGGVGRGRAQAGGTIVRADLRLPRRPPLPLHRSRRATSSLASRRDSTLAVALLGDRLRPGCRPTCSATVATRGGVAEVIASPPVRREQAAVGACSQRGGAAARQPAVGHDDVGLGAGADQPVPARRDGGVRVASSRQRRPSRSRSTAHRSRLQEATGRRVELEIIGLAASTARRACRGHSRPRAVAQQREPSVAVAQGEMAAVAGDQQIGRGRRERPDAPTATDQARQRRQRVRHRQSHSPPATISAKAPRGIAGSSATAPGAAAVAWASQSRSASACPASHQNGAPSPTRSSSRPAPRAA